MRQERAESIGTGRLPDLRGKAGERGMILVLTLVVLLVLSMLAGASLINGLLQRSQARTEANAAIALHAAEAGVAAGMAWLSDPDNLDDVPDVPDPDFEYSYFGSFTNGGHYDGTVAFKRERRDRNEDGDCCDTYDASPNAPMDEDSGFKDGDANDCTDCDAADVVLYNAGSGDGGFGFPGAYFAGDPGDEGFPVIEIVSIGKHGASAEREIALFVARNHKAQVEGRLTSHTQVNPDIWKHTDESCPPSCGPGLPDYSLDPAVADLPCDTNGDGECKVEDGECSISSTCPEYFDATQPGKRELGKTPWDVLGMSEVDFRSLFSVQDTSTLDAGACGSPVNLWFQGDLTDIPNNALCEGILVVHNPAFDPDRWDPASPSYDAVYAAKPENAPAAIDTSGGGNFTWNGIIVVDFIRDVNANISVYGGVISLASGGLDPKTATPITTGISGDVDFCYDCDAVAAVTKRIGYKKKIGWQRVR